LSRIGEAGGRVGGRQLLHHPTIGPEVGNPVATSIPDQSTPR